MAVKSEASFIILLTSKAFQLAFTEFSGGDQTRSVEEYADPMKDKSGYVLGTAKYTPVVVRVPYDPKEHDTPIAYLKKFCVGEDDTLQVSVQPMIICPEQTPDGKARTYLDCLPSTIRFPQVKRGNAVASMLEVTLNPGDMKFQ